MLEVKKISRLDGGLGKHRKNQIGTVATRPWFDAQLYFTDEEIIK